MIGRKEEIRDLEWDLSKDEPQFVAVYGRRRVGKTYLIRTFFKDDFAFYHTGLRKGTRQQQLLAFRESLEKYGYEGCPVPSDWMEAFRLLLRLIEMKPSGRKVLFIDELPWMDTPRSDLVMALDHFWNAWATARREKDVFLVVCGSAASWIIKNIVRNRGGLHNRLTDRIKLEPFTLSECEAYAQELSLRLTRDEICEYYMAIGGIPFYWSLLKPEYSVAQNMDALFFSKGGQLREEYGFLYASLFRTAEQHLKIVEALAKKPEGMSRDEICAATGIVKGGSLKMWLEELEQCGFIGTARYPGRKTRDMLFRLTDAYTLFYHRFVLKNEKDDEHFWTHTLNTSVQNVWRGLAFERVCHAHVKQIKEALGISGMLCGTYAWRSMAKDTDIRGAQIDLVIDRADKTVNLCEIKYAKDLYEIKKDYSRELIHKCETFRRETGLGVRGGYRLTFITTHGLVRNAYWNDVQSEVTLDDLFRNGGRF